MAWAPSVEPVAVILGSHPFPHGNASANRMLSLALTWKSAGWRPVVINDHPESSGDMPDAGLRRVAGVEYVNLHAPRGSRWDRHRRRSTLPDRVVEAMRPLDFADRVTHLVFPSMLFTPRLSRTLLRELPAAVTVVDVVERHAASQFRGGRVHPYYLRHAATNIHAARRADKVIVISRALASSNYRKAPLVLPPCVDVAEFRTLAETIRERLPVRVTYFGSPGLKDDLASLIAAIPAVPGSARGSLRVAVAGVDRAALMALPGVTHSMVERAGANLEVVGRLDRAGVLELLSRTHFSVLLRDPQALFARCGFPSKVPESWAAGCPTILNLSSDLGDYARYGVNALICADRSVSAVARELTRAVDLVSAGDHDPLRTSSRETAVEHFSPHAWSDALKTWLGE